MMKPPVSLPAIQAGKGAPSRSIKKTAFDRSLHYTPAPTQFSGLGRSFLLEQFDRFAHDQTAVHTLGGEETHLPGNGVEFV